VAAPEAAHRIPATVGGDSHNGPYRALEQASEFTGDNRTDTINRALLVYALVHELADQGGGSLTIINKNGEKELVYIL
jgi:hypothetical protein